MRILFFIDDMGAGGKQRRLLELIKGLLKQQKVHVILVLTQKEILYTEILNLDIEIIYCLRKSKRDLTVFLRLFKVVKNAKPNLLHVWGNLETLYILPTKIILGTPMLNSQITDAPSNFRNKFLNHNLTFPFSEIISANSFAGLEAYGVSKDKGVVIYNGFDFNRNNNVENSDTLKLKLDIKSKFIIGMFASFDSRKDYSTFIKAIKVLNKSYKNITFLCVGDGDYQIHKNSLEKSEFDNVIFLGHQKNVESLMNICDVGVLTTFTEGISNSLLEFMSLGKPVVVSGAGGCKETVIDGENGFLLPIGDFEGVAEKINSLIKDKHLRNQMGNKGVKMIQDKFSISQMIDNFYGLYTRLMRSHRFEN